MKLRTKLLAGLVALGVTGAATSQIWGPVVGGLVNGGVVYGAGGIVAQNATKFFWDGTNYRLGIGNGAPTVELDVTGSQKVSGTLAVTGATTLTGGVTGAVAATGAVSGTTGTFTSTLAVTGASTLTGGIVGTATNNSAAAGHVGEYVESVILGVAAAATGVFQDSTTLALTAGDWDCTGQWKVVYDANSTLILVGLSTGTAGNAFSDQVPGSNESWFYPKSTGTEAIGLTVPAWRVSAAGATTLRMKSRVTYSSGSPSVSGRISCRRVR